MPNVNCNIHNRFDIEVIDAKSGEIKQRAQAENIILDALWTIMLAPGSYFRYIHYGTGAGTPAANRTSLFSFLGYGTPTAAEDVYTVNAAARYYSVRRKIQLSESTAVGATLTEVGVGHSTTAASLCTHAMLKDMNGNPVSIAKTATDIVNIYATIYVHWSESWDGGHIKFTGHLGYTKEFLKCLAGMSNFGAKAYYAGVYNTKIPPQYNDRNYVTLSASKTYSVANKTITLTMPRIAADKYNVGGYPAVYICNPLASDARFCEAFLELAVGGAWYGGSTIVGEAIGTGNGSTKDFATGFPFISNPTVYVNGVAQTSGVAVDTNKPLSYMERCFEFLTESNALTSATGHYASPGLKSTGASEAMYYNPNYALGIDTYYADYANTVFYVSNDLATWVTITSAAGTNALSPTYKNYKYFKFVESVVYNFTSVNAPPTNIHFATAPASGAVITADYTTKTIAKDANHVFDCSITIQLGELIV